MKKSIFITVPRVVAALSLAIMAPMAVLADMPGRHPGYMHAISDLKAAKWLLARPDAPNVVGDEMRAVQEVDACLRDLTQAAWFDGKNVHEQPMPDIGLDRDGRLHKALELLRKAHSDMDREEDDPVAIGLQARAIKHVDRAIGFNRRAIGDKFDDGFLRL